MKDASWLFLNRIEKKMWVRDITTIWPCVHVTYLVYRKLKSSSFFFFDQHAHSHFPWTQIYTNCFCWNLPQLRLYEYFSWSQSVKTPALEAEMILTGIRLRAALLNLWILIESRAESDFPSAAQRDIFSQTGPLLLKYTKAAQEVNFLWFWCVFFSLFFLYDFWHQHDSHWQWDRWSHKATSYNRGRCFPSYCSNLIQEKEEWETQRVVGGDESQHSS